MYSNGYVPAYGSENDQLNPWVAATQTGYQETWNNKLQANATLEQSLNFITKGLKFIGRYGFDTNNYQWINRKKFPEMWRAEQNRASDGSLVMKKIKDEQLMTQESSSNGNRKEYLEAELHYDRTFGDHIVGAVFKYSQDKTIDTSRMEMILCKVLINAIKDLLDASPMDGNTVISSISTLGITVPKTLHRDISMAFSQLILQHGILQKNLSSKNI